MSSSRIALMRARTKLERRICGLLQKFEEDTGICVYEIGLDHIDAEGAVAYQKQNIRATEAVKIALGPPVVDEEEVREDERIREDTPF